MDPPPDEQPIKVEAIASWDELIMQLARCQDYLEDAYIQTDIHDDQEEKAGEAHAARLLGHVTDAMLLAVWFKGVALAVVKTKPT